MEWRSEKQDMNGEPFAKTDFNKLESRQTKTTSTNIFFNGILFFISCIVSPSTQAIFRVIRAEYQYLPLFIPLGLMNAVWKPVHDLVLWALRGFKRMADLPYEESAHVEKVLWAVKPMAMETVRRGYYLTLHEEYAHPRCVFSDNVMLAKVYRDQAIFVDFGKPVQEHYHIQKAVWLWDELIFDAQRIITVPIKTFHRLAERELTKEQRIDSHAEDLTLLYGTSRCGSTLIGKIAGVLNPDTLVLGEPVPFFDLIGFYARIPNKEHARLSTSTLRLLCKPHKGVKRFFFKGPNRGTFWTLSKMHSQRMDRKQQPLSLALGVARLCRRLCPKARVVFCYRDPVQTAHAHERAFGYSFGYRLYQSCSWIDHGMKDWLGNNSQLHRNSHVDAIARKIWRFPNMFQIGFEIWIQHYLSYMEQSKEYHFPSVYYDTVLTDPEKFCKEVLELIGMDSGSVNLEKAKSILKTDAQAGRTLAQKNLNGFPKTKIDRQMAEKMVQFCREVEIPEHIYKSCTLLLKTLD